MQGTVKWFSPDKGYGFITSSVGEDHYFNVRDVVGACLPGTGDAVSFDSQAGSKGLRAAKVVITAKADETRSSSSAGRHDDRVDCP